MALGGVRGGVIVERMYMCVSLCAVWMVVGLQ